MSSKYPGLVSAVNRARKGWFLYPLITGRYELAVSPLSIISAEYIGGKYSRYDVIVRLLAVENYFGRNDDGFLLYKKMQIARGAPVEYETRFCHLIDRVSRYGYDWKSALDVTRDGYLLDGAHRVALALYCDVPAVSVRPHYSQRGPVSYELDWFIQHGFTNKECTIIEQRRQHLFWEKGLYFPIILWPPVAEYFNQIDKDISYKTVKSANYTFDDREFEKNVRAIYEIDDIDKWKIDKKLSHMAPYEKQVRVIWVEIPNPEYRKKSLNNADISRVGEQVKMLIRNKYKGTVPNYVYDVICHTGDNWNHNQTINSIFDGNCIS